MEQQQRRRIIKEEDDNEVTAEENIEIEEEDTEKVEEVKNIEAMVMHTLHESSVLIRNMMARADGGYTDMEIGALIDALVAFEVAGENPVRFIELKEQFLSEISRSEETKEKEEISNEY